MKPYLLLLAALVASQFPQAFGGEPVRYDSKRVVTESDPFEKGKLEMQSASGAYFIVSSHRPSLNYSSTAYRLGIMLDSAAGDGWLRGNWEAMLQLSGGSVFKGPGNYLLGAGVILRRNFVQPESKWVPYVQIGVGGIYNDIWKDPSQRLIGQNWEFGLEAAVGVRYFFNTRWSANLEGGYRHISNLDLADRNVGLDSVGAAAGLGLHF